MIDPCLFGKIIITYAYINGCIFNLEVNILYILECLINLFIEFFENEMIDPSVFGKKILLIHKRVHS